MRRSWLLLPVLAAACQQAAVSPSATLVGLRDIVRVGDFMVATSTERDELRVLDLETENPTAPRRYVRAPNPIQALSIPVLKRPTTLVTDTLYEGEREIGGPYVYASSPGTPQISIVWAEDLDRSRSWTEVARLQTIAPVTAMAAEGSPRVNDRPRPGTFYFATFDGETTTLFRLEPRPPEQIAEQNLQAEVRVLLVRRDQSIIDMVALPGGRLAVASRAIGGNTAAGDAVVLDGRSGSVLVTLQFPSPVRALYTHGQFSVPQLVPEGTMTPPTLDVPAGGRIYGVLDETSCGSAACSGLVAVDSDTGLRSLSGAGLQLDFRSVPREQREAPPLTFGAGLIQSVSLAVGGNLPFPETITASGTIELRSVPLLGAVSLSNGQLGFFLASELRQLNIAGSPTAQVTTPDGGVFGSRSVSREDGNIDVSGADGGPAEGIVVTLANGAVQDETVFIVANGVLPELGELPLPAGGDTLLATPRADRARVGDTLEGCPGGGTITAVEAGGLRFSGTCTGPTVAVRAAGAEPYVVVGTVSGYMGRTAPGATFQRSAPYQHHFTGYRPDRPAISVAIPADPLLPDDRYTVVLEDAYLPMVMQLSTTVCATGFTTFPGAVVLDPLRSATGRVFVAYPSANGIVEIDNQFIRRSFTQERGLLCWR